MSSGANAVAVDTSGNVYVCGFVFISGVIRSHIAKYNTSGEIQWQRQLGNSGFESEGYGIAVDSSGNAYVCGRAAESGQGSNLQIAKYNTNGTIQWQRQLSSTSNEVANAVTVDASSNVYISGYSVFGSYQALQIAKYNTSGSLQWQKVLGASGSTDANGVTVDSSGNVYICGSYRTTGFEFSIQIAKYDTNGALQWQRSLGSNGVSDLGRGASVDKNGNVYVCGSSGSNLQIAKYDTSGTLQWQRRITASVSVGRSIVVDTSENMYVCGNSNVSGQNSFVFAKLPGSGAKTGTYTVGGYSITYASSSLTDSTSSLTDSTSSLTDAASSLSDGSSSLVDASSSLTSSITSI